MRSTNVPAEMMVLAIIYDDPTEFALIEDCLGDQDFTTPEHKLIFQIFRHLYGNNILQIQFEHVLSTVKELDIDEDRFHNLTVGGEYVENILNYNPQEEDIIYWLTLLKQATVKRLYPDEFQKLSHYLETTQDSLEEIVERVENSVLRLGRETQKGQEVSDRIFKRAEEVLVQLAEDPLEGINIELPIWQETIGLLQNKTVHFVVAYTGAGKSQFALRAAMIACRKMPVLYCDSEMDEEIAIVRGFCCIHEIPFNYLRYGWWNKSEEELKNSDHIKNYIRIKNMDMCDFLDDIKKCKTIISNKDLWSMFDKIYADNFHYINIKGVAVSKALHRIRRWLMTYARERDIRNPECFVIIDQIKTSDFNELKEADIQEWQFLGVEMSKLHDFAHKYNLPVLVMGQTNSMGDVQGAKRLKDTASSVTIMSKKDHSEIDQDPSGNMKLVINKSRHGGLSHGMYINIGASTDRCYFKEIGIAGLKDRSDDKKDRLPKDQQDSDAQLEQDSSPDEGREQVATDDEWTGG